MTAVCRKIFFFFFSWILFIEENDICTKYKILQYLLQFLICFIVITAVIFAALFSFSRKVWLTLVIFCFTFIHLFFNFFAVFSDNDRHWWKIFVCVLFKFFWCLHNGKVILFCGKEEGMSEGIQFGFCKIFFFFGNGIERALLLFETFVQKCCWDCGEMVYFRESS